MNTKIVFEQFRKKGTAITTPIVQPSSCSFFRKARTSIIMIFAVTAASCTPTHPSPTPPPAPSPAPSPEVVQSSPPQASYEYTTDEGLIAAHHKAREYCRHYVSLPNIQGSITRGSDNTRRVNFECVKHVEVVTTLSPLHVYSASTAPPRGYIYSSDDELLQTVQSAEADCGRTDQTASISITTDTDGVKILTYQCVSR